MLGKILELKDAASDAPELGEFTGLASVYNVTDRDGDIVLPGAFEKSIAGGREIPILYQHDQRSPIGKGVLTDSPNGLQITGRLIKSPDVPDASKAWALMKAGVIDSLSIGYRATKSAFKDGARLLQEIELFEVSLVTIPANPFATVLTMKAQRTLGAIDAVKASEDGAVEALFEAVAALSEELAAKRPALSERNRMLVEAAKAALVGMFVAPQQEDAQVSEDDAKALRRVIGEFAALAASTKG